MAPERNKRAFNNPLISFSPKEKATKSKKFTLGGHAMGRTDKINKKKYRVQIRNFKIKATGQRTS